MLDDIAQSCLQNYSQCMTNYDLEERTFAFVVAVREFLKVIPITLANIEYQKQLIRSSASISANYLEANDALGDKDFLMRVRIARKEAKETYLWLRLLDLMQKSELETQRLHLMKETKEFRLILSSIINKATSHM